MYTMRDVLAVGKTVLADVDLFGADNGFEEEFKVKFENVGLAIREEYGLIQEEAKAGKLPLSTKLGPRASALFAGLKDWLTTKEKQLDLFKGKHVEAGN